MTHATYGALLAVAAAVVAGVLAGVRVLPEAIDISLVSTMAGLGALTFTTYGALRRFEPGRIGRLTIGGTVLGGLVGLGIFVIAAIVDVL